MAESVTLLEASKMCGLGRNRLIQLIQDGKVKAIKVESPNALGFYYKISVAELSKIKRKRRLVAN